MARWAALALSALIVAGVPGVTPSDADPSAGSGFDFISWCRHQAYESGCSIAGAGRTPEGECTGNGEAFSKMVEAHDVLPDKPSFGWGTPMPEGGLCAALSSGPWWPADPYVGQSQWSSVADSPASAMARLLRNKTIAFVGDSTTRHVHAALVCALRRDASLQMERAECAGLRSSWRAEATGACFAIVGDSNRYDGEKLQALVDTDIDVIYLNIGLHYISQQWYDKYEGNLREVMKVGAEGMGAKGGRFIFALTQAQHFISKSGRGDWIAYKHENAIKRSMGDAPHCTCAQVENVEQDQVNLNNKLARELASENGGVQILDLFKATIPRWDMHKGSCGCPKPEKQEDGSCSCENESVHQCDCTHQCYSPAFFDHAFELINEQLA